MCLKNDIELRELRDFNVNVTQQLSQIATQQGELQSPMQILFSQVPGPGSHYIRSFTLFIHVFMQAGLPPPSSAPASRSSSQQSSPRGSTVTSR